MSGTFRYIALISVIIFGSIIALVYIMNPPAETISTVNIKVHYNAVSNATVQLYHTSVDNSGNYTRSGESISTIVSDVSYTVKKDVYIAEVSGSDIEPSSTVIDASDNSQNVTISVDKLSATLRNMANNESSTIYSSLAGSYKNLSSLYTATDIRLYGDGNWASVTLRYTGKGQQSRDTLYSVLHKQSDRWAVVAEPKISVSKADLPKSAPLSIVRHITPGKIDVKSLQNSWQSS